MHRRITPSPWACVAPHSLPYSAPNRPNVTLSCTASWRSSKCLGPHQQMMSGIWLPAPHSHVPTTRMQGGPPRQRCSRGPADAGGVRGAYHPAHSRQPPLPASMPYTAQSLPSQTTATWCQRAAAGTAHCTALQVAGLQGAAARPPSHLLPHALRTAPKPVQSRVCTASTSGPYEHVPDPATPFGDGGTTTTTTMSAHARPGPPFLHHPSSARATDGRPAARSAHNQPTDQPAARPLALPQRLGRNQSTGRPASRTTRTTTSPAEPWTQTR